MNQLHIAKPARPVDIAMLMQRDAKQTIRELWIDKAKQHAANHANKVPLYLTLPGAAATEIELLISAGLIKTEENGAIHKDSAHSLICVEQDHTVLLSIQRKYSGLKLIRGSIVDMIHGNSLMRFPDGERERHCRAHVVNLDLNETWSPQLGEDNALVPVLRWIKKFGEMHARDPKIEWSLLLTVHGECPWNDDQALLMKNSIASILQHLPAGMEELSNWLGAEIFAQISAEGFVGYRELPRDSQQKLLMWLVPAMISEQCHAQGWLITVDRNLHYGNYPVAPMVTWILDFKRAEPKLHYQDEHKACFASILSNAGYIEDNGVICSY